MQVLELILREDFEFEFATYVNATMPKRSIKDVQRVLVNREVTKEGVSMKGIVKKTPQERMELEEQKRPNIQESNEMEEEEDIK